MDWKLFLATFGMIFAAEIGDKTQLVVLATSSQTKSTWTVWLAVVAALSVVSALGVIVGRAMGQWLPVTAIRYVSAALFFAAGAWILLKP